MLRIVISVVLVLALSGVRGQTSYCQGGCYYNGVCYSHGNTWKEDCSTKRCRQLTHLQAIVETIATECKDAYGHCKSHGDEMTVNMEGVRVTCRCVVGQDRWDYTQCASTQPVNPGSNCKSCEVDGVCRAFGDIFQKDCFTYECRPYGNSWRAEVVKAGCKDADGHCRASGSYMPYIQHGQRYENCMCTVIGTSARYQCEGATGTTTICNGCKVDGVCHSVNSRWTKDCLTYQCKQVLSAWIFAKIVSAQCKDAYGHCRNHNEHMSAVIGGYTFNNCVCLINGLQISHQCSS